MKKLSAIVLLALLLFNLAGYRLVFQLLQQQHQAALEANLNNNRYNNNDLIEIRVPISMPYLPGETGFERIDGEISVDGQSYKYVKRKVENGHLILLCIPDHRKTGIEQAKTTYGSSVNDYPLAGKKSAEKPGKTVIGPEYDETSSQLMHVTPAILQPTFIDYYAALLTPGFTTFAEHPPQVYFS